MLPFYPWKGAWPCIWTNLNLFHPRMLCVKFGWNWPSGSGEEDFKISTFCIHIVRFVCFCFSILLLSPLYEKILCAKFDWNGGEEDENVKNSQTVRRTDRRLTTGDQKKSSLELSASIWYTFMFIWLHWLQIMEKGCVKTPNYLRFNLWSHARSIKFFTYIIRYAKIELLKISGFFFCEFFLIKFLCLAFFLKFY